MHTHISRDDRIVIADGLRRQESISFIASRIRKNKGSVSREIKRNTGNNGEYFVPTANRLARERRENSKQKYRLIENSLELSKIIEKRLEPLISPEVIAHELKIHHQTIYSWLYRTRTDLLSQLPQRGRKRRKYGSYREINVGWTKTAKSIHDRVETDLNWEGDTVRGKTKPKLLTHVERKSLYLVADLLPDGTADAVQGKMSQSNITGTITYDRGTEFALWKMIEKETGASVYFADAYQPQQRGKNENTNGRLRRVYPKGFDFATINQRDLNKVVWKMNHTPRKSLSWQTPCEVYERCCIST
jgi:transposase, IS30 family